MLLSWTKPTPSPPFPPFVLPKASISPGRVPEPEMQPAPQATPFLEAQLLEEYFEWALTRGQLPRGH